MMVVTIAAEANPGSLTHWLVGSRSGQKGGSKQCGDVVMTTVVATPEARPTSAFTVRRVLRSVAPLSFAPSAFQIV